MGLQAKIQKKWRNFALKKQSIVSENLLNKEFSATRPNEKWVTDIIYLTFNNKRIYLSMIFDFYNNEGVVYQMSKYNNLKLVTDTFNKA